MSTYQARARREGRYWVVDVEGIGVTQARTVREIRVMASDLIGILSGEPVGASELEIEFELPGDLGESIREARRQYQEAQQGQARAAASFRSVARALRAQGLSVHDAGAVLGVSAQRVSQLAPTGESGRLGHEPGVSLGQAQRGSKEDHQQDDGRQQQGESGVGPVPTGPDVAGDQ